MGKYEQLLKELRAMRTILEESKMQSNNSVSTEASAKGNQNGKTLGAYHLPGITTEKEERYGRKEEAAFFRIPMLCLITFLSEVVFLVLSYLLFH